MPRHEFSNRLLGQQRAASAAGPVMTSATVQPSPVIVTDVTTSPGIPSSAVAAAQDGAQQAGAACAGPGQPVASTKAVPMGDSSFFAGTRIPEEPPSCPPVYVIHSHIC